MLSKLEAACAGAARDEAYLTAAKRAAQPPSYYGDRATFGQRLARDIDTKKRLIERMRAQR